VPGTLFTSIPETVAHTTYPALADPAAIRKEQLKQTRAETARKEAIQQQQADAFRGVHLDPKAHHWDEVKLVHSDWASWPNRRHRTKTTAIFWKTSSSLATASNTRSSPRTHHPLLCHRRRAPQGRHSKRTTKTDSQTILTAAGRSLPRRPGK
jgi:membrane-bound lytic murein transglycosylase B